MVTSTTDQLVWRVELDIIHSELTKTGIICFIRLTTQGMILYYCHHCIYSRSVARGPWSPGTMIRQPLNGALKSMIEAGAMPEFWDLARVDIQIWPGDPGSSVAEVDLGV